MKTKDWPELKEENVPYYVQIYDIIYDKIKKNELKEDDTLPGENILAQNWNVSRSTVRLAIRKLEEDGFIYKMQGKKTTVTGQGLRNKDGLQRLSNPCLSSCIESVTNTEMIISVQNGGRLVSDLLNFTDRPFTAAAVDIKYYVHEIQVASSVTIIPITLLEQESITVEEKEQLRELALHSLHNKAKWSHLSFSSIEKSEEETDKPKGATLLVMDEVLYEENAPMAYCKYWMDADWYRFSLDRRK